MGRFGFKSRRHIDHRNEQDEFDLSGGDGGGGSSQQQHRPGSPSFSRAINSHHQPANANQPNVNRQASAASSKRHSFIPQHHGFYPNYNTSSLMHNQPMVLMTPPKLARNDSSPGSGGDGHGNGNGNDDGDNGQEFNFDGFDGVHIKDDEPSYSNNSDTNGVKKEDGSMIGNECDTRRFSHAAEELEQSGSTSFEIVTSGSMGARREEDDAHAAPEPEHAASTKHSFSGNGSGANSVELLGVDSSIKKETPKTKQPPPVLDKQPPPLELERETAMTNYSESIYSVERHEEGEEEEEDRLVSKPMPREYQQEYELEPEEDGEKDVQSATLNLLAEIHDDHDYEDEYTDDEPQVLEVRNLNTNSDEEETDDDVQEIPPPPPARLEADNTNEPTLYHPKPRRMISHNFENDPAVNPNAEANNNHTEDDLATFSISFDEELNKGVEAPLADDALQQPTNVHARSQSYSFTPHHAPKHHSAGQMSLDLGYSSLNKRHSRISSIVSGLPAAADMSTHSHSRSHSHSHSRQVSGSASLKSAMSRRSSILEPHPTDVDHFPPPPPPPPPVAAPEENNNEPRVYYPAPIPMQLRVPPLLSKKKRGPEMAAEPPAHFNPRRASTILEPPTWNANNTNDRQSMASMAENYPIASRQSVYSSLAGSVYEDEDLMTQYQSELGGSGGNRSASPALSMDSGRATIESDFEDRNLGQEVGDTKPLPGKTVKKTGSSKNKTQKKNKRRSFLLGGGKKKKPDYLEESSDDGGEDEVDYSQAPDEDDIAADSATRNVDHLAFTHYDQNMIDYTANNFVSLGTGGVVPGPSTQPTSLIEELELRKAGRKARSNMVKQEIKQGIEALDESKRRSLHPLDVRQSRSLMQLQEIANHDYDEQVNYQRMSRMSQLNLNPHNSMLPPQQQAQEENPNETLAERRSRLKQAKHAAEQSAMTESETLAERRARLKRERQEQRQSQMLVA